MSAQHTPGPWEVVAFSQNDVVCSEHFELAHVFSPTSGSPLDAIAERRANACLIATAPDLLDVVREYVSCGLDVGAPEWKVKLFMRAKAALKKTDGEP